MQTTSDILRHPTHANVLQLQDVDLHYELCGSGAPVLFIQGVGVTGEGWRPQVEGLQEQFQPLVFDNRGIGRSIRCRGPITIEAMAADARALLDHVGWESAHVVGHSMGGVIAQQLALDCPQRIRSLSLLCTFARGSDAARLTPWTLWMGLRTRIGTRRMRRHAFLEMIVPGDELHAADLDDLATRMAQFMGRDLADQPPVLLRQVRALARHDCSARLRELAGIPTLVLSAEHDPIALPRFGRMLADAIPGAAFEQLPAASHAVTMQQAATINQRLCQFFNTCEPKVFS